MSVHAPAEAPDWYRDAVFYELRVRAFFDASGDGIGDFVGLIEKLDYLVDLGVTALWLLPFYPSPLRDDGYDVSDYTDVHEDVGTRSDFKRFLREAHHRGLRVVIELILDRTSDQHHWFERSRVATAGTRARDFYLWSDRAAGTHAPRVPASDDEESSWRWDPLARSHYRHRLCPHEPDLNYEHPPVRKAMRRVVDHWLDLGVDGLRLVGLPFLYKASRESRPKVCDFLRELRMHVAARFSDRVLIADWTSWDRAAYSGPEDPGSCSIALQHSIAPCLLTAVTGETAAPLLHLLRAAPMPDAEGQWIVRFRDDEQLAPEDICSGDAHLLASGRRGPRRRIWRRLAPLVQNDRRKIELWNGLLFSLPGSPVVYYGDEIGMGDNPHLVDRSGVRTPMQWSADCNAGFSRANTQRLFLPVIVDPEYHYEVVNVETQASSSSSLLSWMKRIVAIRRQHPSLSRGSIRLLDAGNQQLIAFVRELGNERILMVANLSRFVQFVELDLSAYEGMVPVEIFGQKRCPRIARSLYLLTPGPMSFLWFSLESEQSVLDLPMQSEEVPGIVLPHSVEGSTDGRGRQVLEWAVASYLQRCGWYDAGVRLFRRARIAKAWTADLHGQSVALVWLDVDHYDDSTEGYLLPLLFEEQESRAEEIPANAWVARIHGGHGWGGVNGALVDGLQSESCVRALWGLFGRFPCEQVDEADLRVYWSPWYVAERGLDEASPVIRRTDGDARCVDFVVNERYALRWHRRLRTGPDPDVEISCFLTERWGFPCTPRIGAWMEVGDCEESVSVAVVREIIPGAKNAAEVARAMLVNYLDRAVVALGGIGCRAHEEGGGKAREARDTELAHASAFAQRLGACTARLHETLSRDGEDPEFAPESYSTLDQRSLYRQLSILAITVLRQLYGYAASYEEELRKRAEALCAREGMISRQLEKLWTRRLTGARIRVHGDFRLERLGYDGETFWISGFGGERVHRWADRRKKVSPLRDVAAMIRSLHRIAWSGTAGHRLLGISTEAVYCAARVAWYRSVRSVFLQAYLSEMTHSGVLGEDLGEREFLLNVFLLENAIEDLGRGLEREPAQIAVALRALEEWLDTREEEASAASGAPEGRATPKRASADICATSDIRSGS